MDRGKFTQEEIEKIMQSTDAISRAEPAPFFYTRLQAKIDSGRSSSNGFWLLVTKPAVSLISLSLLLILNIAAISYYSKSSQQPAVENSSAIQKFAEEYDLGTSSVYNDKTSNE
jgi:hypothetical protein